MVDAGLFISYILLIVAVGAAIVFPLLYAIKTPGVFIKSLMGLGALVVLFGISYALSGSKVVPSQAALGVTEGSSKLIGAGLIMLYLSLIASVVGLIFSEISKAFK
jgi:hypothetical protein